MEDLPDILNDSENILLNKEIIDKVKYLRPSLNNVVSQCLLNQMEVPAFSEATNYLNGYTNLRSSANLIQAQRDYFGAHTYQKNDDLSKKFYHMDWNRTVSS